MRARVGCLELDPSGCGLPVRPIGENVHKGRVGLPRCVAARVAQPDDVPKEMPLTMPPAENGPHCPLASFSCLVPSPPRARHLLRGVTDATDHGACVGVFIA